MPVGLQTLCTQVTCTELVQVLKIIRYTSKLVLAGALSDPSSELAVRLKAFESSIGTSRYRCCYDSSLHSASFRGISLFCMACVCQLRNKLEMCSHAGKHIGWANGLQT